MLKYLSGSSQEEIVLSDKKIRAKIRTSGLYDSEWEVEDTKQAQGRKVEELESRWTETKKYVSLNQQAK